MARPAARIPFNRPSMVGGELQALAAAVASGHLAGDGPMTRSCEARLQALFGGARVLLTHSCTAALELAALLTEVGPGDEVIMPSFTFVSTANAFVLRGARPVFVDIHADTLNLDEDLIAEAIGPRSRVVVPVHYGGVSSAMDRVLAIARQHRLRVVEDAAQALGSTWDGQALGTLGDLGCWSFHETKNLTSGEGGALVLADDSFAARAEVLREKGTNRAQMIRGELAQYTWVDVGSSYLPSELVAAFLGAQLEQAAQVQSRRLAICGRYRQGLVELEASGAARLPAVPARCGANGHMFYLLLADGPSRDRLIAQLAARGIQAVSHYVPLHESPMGRLHGRVSGSLATTESASRRLLRLPCFYGLTESQQDEVIAAVLELVLGRRSRRREPRSEGRSPDETSQRGISSPAGTATEPAAPAADGWLSPADPRGREGS